MALISIYLNAELNSAFKCMIAILNRVAHLLMQMFPGIGGMTPTSCAGFVWTQTLLANYVRYRDALLAI